MVGRRLSGLRRRGACESDEEKEVRIYGSIYQSNYRLKCCPRYSYGISRYKKIPIVETIPVTWTLANEALPPNGENVLCWYEYFRFGEYNRMYQTFGIGYQFNGNWGGEVAQGQKVKVLAWTPLPKPPKMKRGVKNG